MSIIQKHVHSFIKYTKLLLTENKMEHHLSIYLSIYLSFYLYILYTYKCIIYNYFMVNLSYFRPYTEIIMIVNRKYT